MERTSSLLVIIISLSSMVLFANASTPNNFNALANKPSTLLNFCTNMTYVETCVEKIAPYYIQVAGKGVIEPMKALNVTVEATAAQTKKTIAVMEGLLAKNNVTDELLKNQIGSCMGQYNFILSSVDETKEAMKEKNMVEARAKFSAVISYQQTCADMFEQSEYFPFDDDSKAVRELGSVCLDIIVGIQTSSFPTQAV